MFAPKNRLSFASNANCSIFVGRKEVMRQPYECSDVHRYVAQAKRFAHWTTNVPHGIRRRYRRMKNNSLWVRPRNAAAYARQCSTLPTMSQLSLSRSPSICELRRLVLVNAAQQNPLCVRTATVVVPG